MSKKMYSIAKDFRRRMLRFNQSLRGASLTTAEVRRLTKMMRAEFRNTLYYVEETSAYDKATKLSKKTKRT